MNRFRAFLLGVVEFRLTCTTGFDTGSDNRDAALYDAYGWGREWAHRLTFRRYEP